MAVPTVMISAYPTNVRCSASHNGPYVMRGNSTELNPSFVWQYSVDTHPDTIRGILFRVCCGGFVRSIYDLDSCLGSQPGCRSTHSASPLSSFESRHLSNSSCRILALAATEELSAEAWVMLRWKSDR